KAGARTHAVARRIAWVSGVPARFMAQRETAVMPPTMRPTANRRTVYLGPMGCGAREAQPRDHPGQSGHPGPVFIPDRVACPRRRLSHAALAVASLLVLLAVPCRTFAQTNGCEGSAPEVAKVSFEGNKAVPSQTLEATIETAPSSGARRFTRLFGTRRCLAQGALLRDVARLMLFYRRKGYPRRAVDTAIGRATAPGAVFVRFRIRENEPTRVDSIEIRGVADSAIRSRIRRAIKLQPGEPLAR